MNFYFNPLDTACKSVIGAVSKSQKLDIYVKTTGEGYCNLLLYRDGDFTDISYPMQNASGGFFVSLSGLDVGLYYYKFSLNGRIFGKNSELLAEENCFDGFQLIIYSDDYKTPEWLKGGIIYQIFPDRFAKSGDFTVGVGKIKQENWGSDPIYRNNDGLVLNNEFFGGNFLGIYSKLDYLKSIGVTCVYLNPINKAYSSHRYDTGDYLAVDDVLGTEEDLEKLIQKANSMGIKFIFDGVYNHTGADSVYFNKNGNYRAIGAYNSKNSPYFDWYSFENFPDEYESWWGFETLPSIKKDSKEFQEFICEKVIRKNIELGFSGVRLDVVDELTDEFVESIRKSGRKKDSEFLVVGEVWEDASNKIAYGVRRKYFLGSELDSVMNYPLKDGIICYLLSREAKSLSRVCKEQINNYPKPALDVLMNSLSTHDTPRIITVLGRDNVVTDKDQMKYEFLSKREYKKGVELTKLAYALAFTLYGVPSVFYGDEAGVSGNLDPYNRRTFPWGKEDKNLQDFVKSLAKIRNENSVFKTGDMKILYDDNGVFIFERCDKNSQVITVVSRRIGGMEISFDKPVYDLLTNKRYENTVTIYENEVLILKS